MGAWQYCHSYNHFSIFLQIQCRNTRFHALWVEIESEVQESEKRKENRHITG